MPQSHGHPADQYDGLLPDRMEARLVALLARTAGLLCLAGTAFLWLSLVTWSINDPSLTHGAGTGNAGGAAGAILSDLLLQMLGFGALIVLLAPMMWAFELLHTGSVAQIRSRAALYPLSILFVAGAASSLPLIPGWPFHHGLGGILGDMTANLVSGLFALLNRDAGSLAAGVLLGVAGLSATARSIGADLSTAGQSALRRITSRTAPGSWHEGMRAEARRLAEGDEAAAPASRSPQSWRADQVSRYDDTDDEFDPPAESEDPRDEGWDRVRGAVADLFQNFRRAPETDVEIETPAREVEPAQQLPEPSIAERFAATFDRLDVLRPGSRGALSDGEADSSRSIAARFAPFGASGSPSPSPAAPDRKAVKAELRAARTVFRTPAPTPPPLPALAMLKKPAPRANGDLNQAALRATARQLQDVLADYGVKGEMRDIRPGPVVTLFEFEPVRGTKSARIIALADDIARSMSVLSVRAAVVPGRNVIGLELPNAKREPVVLREIVDCETFRSSQAALPLTLGKSIGGEPIVADLARMPHLLVAGTTGSGKSVGVNAMILSLLYRHTPDTCRFIMIDPKMLELSVYNDIPHLLTPVVTDPRKAVAALGWAVSEMEERYKRMASLSVRNIEAFNARVKTAAARGERLSRTVQTGFDRATGQPRYERQDIESNPMPYIVVVVDEFADLMIVAGKEIEQAVQRLAQMARAAGIHLIMATQRPSVDIITGTIKANFPTRISFKVTSKIDSRTIINEQGAEQLLGQGDMLYASGSGMLTRVHGPFVSDEEVEAITGHLRASAAPEYVSGITDAAEHGDGFGSAGGSGRGSADDDLYARALDIVLRDRKASTSYIQRRLSIGYNKAADLIERMEREGRISQASSTGKREILPPAA